MTTAEILREARALYEANPSHVPADEMPPGDCHCPLTALATVWALDPNRIQNAIRPHQDAEQFLHDVMGGGIPEWNAEHTTGEVLAAFDKAIEAAAA